MQIEKIKIKTALQKVTSRFPYQWSLDPYRGCLHHCEYCYALYSHQYLCQGSFFDTIYVKENILDILELELKSPKWKHEIIAIGTVSDAYQPIEEELQLMPKILKLLIKYRTPVIISTKSDLILRDYALLEELASLTLVNIAATITCFDDALGQIIEKNAVPSSRRFAMLEQFKQSNAVIGLHLMPIIPLISDTKDNIESIYQKAHDLHIDYVLNGTLYLRGDTRKSFYHFYETTFPQYYPEFIELYRNYHLDNEYKKQLYQWVLPLMKQYQLTSNFNSIIKKKLPKKNEQLSLF